MISGVAWLVEPVATVRPLAEDDRLQLAAPWDFWALLEGGGSIRYTVPAGFCFEGSVPRFFWRVVTPTDPAAWAGFCAHDFLYLLGKIGQGPGRAEADAILCHALRRNGYNWATVAAIRFGVRVFGGRYYSAPLSEIELKELESAGFRR